MHYVCEVVLVPLVRGMVDRATVDCPTRPPWGCGAINLASLACEHAGVSLGDVDARQSEVTAIWVLCLTGEPVAAHDLVSRESQRYGPLDAGSPMRRMIP